MSVFIAGFPLLLSNWQSFVGFVLRVHLGGKHAVAMAAVLGYRHVLELGELHRFVVRELLLLVMIIMMFGRFSSAG